MKYICKICGFVYDDSKQKIPFEKLPENWVCPVCGASKADFELVLETKNEKKLNVSKNKNSNQKSKVTQRVEVFENEDLQKLSVAELSAVCSNLARGCEKQYKFEEMELFNELAKYFAEIAPPVESPNVETLSKFLQEDLGENYPNIQRVAGAQNGENEKDRGALRVCVWGEKVTRMLDSLLTRFRNEGDKMLANTEVWVCTICGFVYVGDKPPEICPVCKVQSWKFEKIERRANA